MRALIAWLRARHERRVLNHPAVQEAFSAEEWKRAVKAFEERWL